LTLNADLLFILGLAHLLIPPGPPCIRKIFNPSLVVERITVVSSWEAGYLVPLGPNLPVLLAFAS
jgi:hypothetical protein